MYLVFAISFKESYRSFLIMMMHGLSVVQMYWCLYSVLPECFRKAGIMMHGFCFFQYGSIKSLSSVILLWYVRYGGLMSYASGREECFKLMTHELSSSVQTDRGKTMTGKGLSSRNHILEMHLHCWLDPQESKKSIAHVIVNEGENVSCVRVRFDRHGPDEIGVNQSKWVWGLLIRTWKWLIWYLPNSTTMTEREGGRNF